MERSSGEDTSTQAANESPEDWVKRIAHDRGWPETSQAQLSGPAGEPIGGLAYRLPAADSTGHSRYADIQVTPSERQRWRDAIAAYNAAIDTAFAVYQARQQAAWDRYETDHHAAEVQWDRAKATARRAWDTAIAGLHHG